MMAAMASIGSESYGGEQRIPLTPEEKADLKFIESVKRSECLRKKGIREWTYHLRDGEDTRILTVLARDRKNADRKARNKGFL